MANFMCQLDEPQGAQIKCYFWMCLDELAFELVDSKQITPPCPHNSPDLRGHHPIH